MFINTNKEISFVSSCKSQKHESTAIAEQDAQKSLSRSGFSRAGQRRFRSEFKVSCFKNDQELIDVLIKYSPNPMLEAAGYGDINAIKILIRHGVKINGPEDLVTPLNWALANEQWETAKFLVQNGHVLNGSAAKNEAPPLFLAIFYSFKNPSCVEIVRAILEKGVDVTSVSPKDIAILGGNQWVQSSRIVPECKQQTPLQYAMSCLYRKKMHGLSTDVAERIIGLLIKYGARN